MKQTPVRIAGEPVTVDTADPVEVTNPYGGAAIALVPRCGPEEVDRACKAAVTALERDDFPQHTRARVLETAADLLRDRVEDFARTITIESGKPIRTARVEAARCVDTLTFAAVEARKLTGEMIPMEGSESGAGKLGFALRVPIGVVAAIASPESFMWAGEQGYGLMFVPYLSDFQDLAQKLALYRRTFREHHGQEPPPASMSATTPNGLTVERRVTTRSGSPRERISRPLASASTMEGDVRSFEGDKTAKAKQVGELVASRAKAAGVETVVFDRAGNKYHGRVAALADGDRVCKMHEHRLGGGAKLIVD